MRVATPIRLHFAYDDYELLVSKGIILYISFEEMLSKLYPDRRSVRSVGKIVRSEMKGFFGEDFKMKVFEVAGKPEEVLLFYEFLKLVAHLAHKGNSAAQKLNLNFMHEASNQAYSRTAVQRNVAARTLKSF